jgi:predicted RNase H-like nuclease (RuvC/YqgF family)
MGENISEIKIGLKNSFSNIRKDMDSLKSDINKNNSEIKELIQQNKELRDLIKELKTEIKSLNIKKQDPLQKEVLNKVKRNRKGLIKAKILELQNIGKSTPEIKEIIVDKDDYCSKATFYRYISELKENKKLKIWPQQ